MVPHTINTGDTGRLKIEDKTDDPGLMTVELWIQSLSPVSVPQLPWSYSINGNRVSWKSFNFLDTTMWQRLSVVHVGTAETFTLHLGSTGVSQLGGPTDHQINLAGYIPPGPSPTGKTQAYVKVDGVWRQATPYINVDGVWKVAYPSVRAERGWTNL